MKLAAIYNVFDGHELLRGSIEQIRPYVDRVYVIWQTVSNFGEVDESFSPVIHDLEKMGLVDVSLHIEPPKGKQAFLVETWKREKGIELAKADGCTHYLLMDVDEYYVPEEFAAAKEKHQTIFPHSITCARIWVYYKSPTLRFLNQDKTIVPFICPIKYNRLGQGWPRGFLADRTRRPYAKVVFNAGLDMHHFSWVRKNISQKIYNSTARNNINRPDIFKDYEQACEGYHVRSIFDDVLISVPDIFKINI